LAERRVESETMMTKAWMEQLGVAAWRAACIDEISRRFAEYRSEPDPAGPLGN
jgi:hypothetical protein